MIMDHLAVFGQARKVTIRERFPIQWRGLQDYVLVHGSALLNLKLIVRSPPRVYCTFFNRMAYHSYIFNRNALNIFLDKFTSREQKTHHKKAISNKK